jgi:hypothetical protein
MVISAYQINNVLRVYGDLLRQRMISSRSEVTETDTSDRISIYVNIRRDTIVDDIISNVIEKITKFKPHDNIEKEVFKTLESEPLKLLAINEDRHNKLIFKEINGNDEVINSLSIKNSKFLTNKLNNITEENVE